MLPIRDHNPSGRTPYVTWALIAINVVIFISYWPLFQTPRELNAFFYEYALIPALVSQGDGWSAFITSQFLHGSWMHLGGNMLFLFIFGDNIEDELGHVKFILFYLACGVAAGLAQYLTGPYSNVPMVGASGAIAGVMGAYLLMFPKARVDILLILIIIFRVFPIPAWIVLLIWFGMQLFGGLGSVATEGGTAYWAHAGGFIAGIILIYPLWQSLGATRFWERTHGHPPHPETSYRLNRTRIPRVPRR